MTSQDKFPIKTVSAAISSHPCKELYIFFSFVKQRFLASILFLQSSVTSGIGISNNLQPCRMIFILYISILSVSLCFTLKIWHDDTFFFSSSSPAGPASSPTCGFLVLRMSFAVLGRVHLGGAEQLQYFWVDTSLFQLRHEALRTKVDSYGDDWQADIEQHEVDPDTLKYQRKLFGTLRREENKSCNYPYAHAIFVYSLK